MRASDVLKITPEGLFCPMGDFHIDPMGPVRRAVITHGHSDHARAGHDAVLATSETLAIMGARYGERFASSRQAVRLGEPLSLGGLTVSFHPAGHVLGSAQILIEVGGYRLVVSGDYKRRRDPTAANFELLRCNAFVTEATFGLPVFTHPPDAVELGKLTASMNASPDRTHLVGAYSLGKAQRLIALLRRAGYDAPIGLHGAMVSVTRLYEALGIELGHLDLLTADRDPHQTCGVVLCPPSAVTDRWSRRFADPVTCFASGWMRIRARARQRGVELPLIVSDHADWPELTRTILETGCSELWVTHGQEDALVHWALQHGIAARPLRLLGYDEDGDGA